MNVWSVISVVPFEVSENDGPGKLWAREIEVMDMRNRVPDLNEFMQEFIAVSDEMQFEGEKGTQLRN